jgi:protein kinase A
MRYLSVFVSRQTLYFSRTLTCSVLPSYPMLKRMTSKLHIGASSKSSVHSLPPPPENTYVNSTLYHRGSISTQRTSESDWSKRGDSLDAIDSADYYQPAVQSTISRPKGTYKLNDFDLRRTLGTGSFGRVHLGTRPLLSF